MAAGNKHLAYKELLNGMEVESPGAKHAFYFGFLERAADRFATEERDDVIGQCERCGSPTSAEVCAFCRLIERASVSDSQPVELSARRLEEKT